MRAIGSKSQIEREMNSMKESQNMSEFHKNLKEFVFNVNETYKSKLSNSITDHNLMDCFYQLSLPREFFYQFERFNEKCYSRNVIFRNEQFELLLLCWGPGQLSRIHNHGKSNCGVRKISGILLERIFKKNQDGVESIREEVIEDNVWYTSNSSFIHQLVNPSKNNNAISLHFYSPPLSEFDEFEEVLLWRKEK